MFDFDDDNSSYDSFEDFCGFKQKDMFRGHPKCDVCGRRSFPGDLNDNDICGMCEEEMIQAEEEEVESSDDSDDEEVPLSKLAASNKGSLCHQSSSRPSKKSTTEKVQNLQKLERAPASLSRPSAPQTMTVTKTPTASQKNPKKVTPNSKLTASPPNTNRLTVVNPYAKHAKIHPTKVTSKAKATVKSRRANDKPLFVTKPLAAPIMISAILRPTPKYPSNRRNRNEQSEAIRRRNVQRAKVKSKNKYIVD